MPSYKVIKSGHIIEIYKYARAVSYGYDDDFISRAGGRDKEGKKDRGMEYKKRVGQNGYNKVRRLINANFNENSLFITLTFKEDIEIDDANYNLKKFFQKMKRKQADFKHVTVLEFTKKGRVHYHMLCNYLLEWNNHKELQAHERALGEVWGHGFVDIGYKKNDNAGAYLIKYMTKENVVDRLEGKKRYFFSRNLEQPQELVGGDALQIIREHESLPPVFTNEYYSDFHGQVEYKEYNPLRYDYNTYKEALKEQEENCLNAAIDEFGDIVEEMEIDATGRYGYKKK